MSTPFESLCAAPESVNPALRLGWELQDLRFAGRLTLTDLIARSGEIDETMEAGERMVEESQATLKRLQRAQPQRARRVPTGF